MICPRIIPGFSNLPIRISLLSLPLLIVLLVLAAAPAADVRAQQPTVSIPTVTGTPEGVWVIQNSGLQLVEVRSGPGRDYPVIGFLVEHQKAYVLGETRGAEWLQIIYLGVPENTGWVYNSQVSKPSGEVSLVTPPPTPKPQTTPTFDPTMEARYPETAVPVALPTFTPPPPLSIPTFSAPSTSRLSGGQLPIGFVIIGLAVVGLFGIALSLLRGR